VPELAVADSDRRRRRPAGRFVAHQRRGARDRSARACPGAKGDADAERPDLAHGFEDQRLDPARMQLERRGEAAQSSADYQSAHHPLLCVVQPPGLTARARLLMI
jgi:hypothetical protein